MMRRLAFAVVALGLAAPTAAQGYDFRLHSFKDDDCERRDVSDPVGVVFYGTGADPGHLYTRDVTYHTSWRHHSSNEHMPTNNQWLETHTRGCVNHDGNGEVASNRGWRPHFGLPPIRTINRYHARTVYWGLRTIYRGYGIDETHYTPHVDVACDGANHRVPRGGFASARNMMVAGYRRKRAHNHVFTRGPGNTDRAKQPCTGAWVGGDGNVTYISYGLYPPGVP